MPKPPTARAPSRLIGRISPSSSFRGVFTRVDTGHIVIGSAGNGLSGSRSRVSTAKARTHLPAAVRQTLGYNAALQTYSRYLLSELTTGLNATLSSP